MLDFFIPTYTEETSDVPLPRSEWLLDAKLVERLRKGADLSTRDVDLSPA